MRRSRDELVSAVLPLFLSLCLLYAAPTSGAVTAGQLKQSPSRMYDVRRPHPALVKIERELRNRTKVPLRLPAILPDITNDNPVFAAVDSVEDAQYSVSLRLTPDCEGASGCSYGSVYGGKSAFRAPQEDVEDEDDRRRLRIVPVNLFGNLQGEFVDAVCYAYCTQAYLRWSENGYHYAIGIKAGTQEELRQVADSAIAMAAAKRQSRPGPRADRQQYRVTSEGAMVSSKWNQSTGVRRGIRKDREQ